MNKLKVVDNPCPLQSLTWECQPLPAYQYFENVRNFLVAARDLNLPAFEASDLERVFFFNLNVCELFYYMLLSPETMTFPLGYI